MACVAFVAWWVIFYHLTPKMRVHSLRTFVTEKSLLRTGYTLPNEETSNVLAKISESSESKATSERTSQAIYIAAISVFLLLIFQWRGVSTFQHALMPWIALLGAISIILQVISADIFVTIFNLFSEKHPEPDPRYDAALKRFFHSQGASTAFSALCAFILFLLLSFSFIYPLLGGVGTGLLVLLGAPYWFDWPHFNRRDELRWRPITKIIAIILALCFWGVSLAILIIN